VRKDEIQLQKKSKNWKQIPIDPKMQEELDSLKTFTFPLIQKPEITLDEAKKEVEKSKLGKKLKTYGKISTDVLDTHKKLESKIELMEEQIVEVKLLTNLLLPEEYSPIIEKLIQEIQSLETLEAQIQEIEKMNEQKKKDHQKFVTNSKKIIEDANRELQNAYDLNLAEYQQEVERKKKENTERRQNWLKEKTRRQYERVRRETEFKTQLERLEKIKIKKENEEEKINDLEIGLGNLKDLLRIFKKIEASVFEKQLSLWNSIFDTILKRFFPGSLITGKISPYREGKVSISEKITIEIELNGEKHSGLQTLSWGQKDLVSLAFVLSVNSLIATPFKIMIFDEIFAHFAVQIVNDEIIPTLMEILSSHYVLFSTHDEMGFGAESIDL
jgi:chromosome segregation ATPase